MPQGKLSLNSFQWAMFNLDTALTGHLEKDVLHMVLDQPATPEAWFDRGDVWYLSDGGYSRVGFNLGHGLYLTSSSRDEVKQAWECCKELRDEVENMLTTVYDA
jgi:hypothetical protein